MERGCTVKISIIIPNFNKGDFIQKAIESIIAQEYNNWEAIVVDDGSSDNSIEIIKKFAGMDARVKLHRRERTPKGGSTCRNIGIENALGDYLIFFDSDDLMSPMCIGERVKLMEANLDLDFAVFPVGTFYKEVGDSTMVWRTKKGDHLKQFLRHDLPWHTMSPIWRTPFVKNKLNGFDESFPRLQDVEFHTRALLQKGLEYKIVHNTTPKCFYRIDHERTKQSQVQGLQTMYQGVKKYIQTFKEKVDDPKIKRKLRGTLFSFLNQLNYSLKSKSVTNVEHHALYQGILSDWGDNTLISKQTIRGLKLYTKLYNAGIYRLKGFNWISKRVIQML